MVSKRVHGAVIVCIVALPLAIADFIGDNRCNDNTDNHDGYETGQHLITDFASILGYLCIQWFVPSC